MTRDIIHLFGFVCHIIEKMWRVLKTDDHSQGEKWNYGNCVIKQTIYTWEQCHQFYVYLIFDIVLTLLYLSKAEMKHISVYDFINISKCQSLSMRCINNEIYFIISY